ncbi:hypothetical protein [Sphingomonas faeni]|uniref:hypothetical protein n=1 Tax=Sphingomonas faeni TaxID=185950 RepID=UPI00335F2D90
MVFYPTMLGTPMSSVGAPGGTSRRVSVQNQLEDNVIAALPAGSVWLDVDTLYNTTAQTWTDRKSGIVFPRISGAMPAKSTGGQNGKAFVQWITDTVFAGPAGTAIWPTAADFTAVAIMASATPDTSGGNGALLGNGRISTTQSAGVATGGSYALSFNSTNSILAMQEGSAVATAEIQTAAGDCAGPNTYLWAMSRAYAENTAAIIRNNTTLKTNTGLTRHNENERLIVGAGGFDGTTYDRKLRNARIYQIMFVRGLALHKSDGAPLLAAIQAYANAKYALY